MVHYKPIHTSANMPRPLEFDRERALIQAMKLFWSQGYTATSLTALLATMGIQRSSFYASFGDKKSLFIECLELFGQRTAAMARPHAESTRSAAQIIWEFFYATVLEVPEARLRNGCLLVNTILEMANTNEKLCELSAKQLDTIEQSFENALLQARQHGHWQHSMTPAQAAEYLMTINQGLRVQCRKGLPRQSVWTNLENALELINLPSHHALASPAGA